MSDSAPSGKPRLANQVAVVTGGARGIGAGIVKRFVEEGARVVFSDILDDKAKQLEKELGENVAFCRADSMSPPLSRRSRPSSRSIYRFQLNRIARRLETHFSFKS
jgi:NAD(P)-dependent dehydrogenase (short-subunit alcohol dehydrogenase family)